MDPSVLTVYKSPFPKIRLGNDHDGGYVIADVPTAEYKLLLSAGIGNDLSFELAFLDKYPDVKCIAYDGSIDSLPANDTPIQFVHKYIGTENTENTVTLHVLLTMNHHIFLKMDIEGHELAWIKSLHETQLDSIDQIVIEFHTPFSENDLFSKINKSHVLIHFHGNNVAGTRCYKDVIIPNIFECTYLHKKFFQSAPELNTDLIPSDLDSSNIGGRDIDIYYPPFVN
jgi:hypothetical protein